MLDVIRDQYNRFRYRKEMQLAALNKSTDELAALRRKQCDISEARAVIQKVAQDTQRSLEYHISNLVTLALASVFPDPYKFVLEFNQRRNKTEADLMFLKGAQRVDPESGSGGGPLDVASFALRVAAWSINKTRPVIILDEPFKFVSVDLQPDCSAMLKMLSKELGLQIIMISHLPDIIGSADKVFSVRVVGGVSVVTDSLRRHQDDIVIENKPATVAIRRIRR